MRTSCVKNGLLMVVILLYIGIAVQPSIAVNPISSDDEDDCGCQDEYMNSLISNRPRCKILLSIGVFYGIKSGYFDNLAENYPEDSLFNIIFVQLSGAMELRATIIFMIGYLIDCWDLEDSRYD